MKRFRVLYYLVFIFLLTLSACKKGDQGPAGPAGPSLTGDLIGYCTLYDVNGNKVTDSRGILVTVEGANRSAITDSAGRFDVTGISTGIYNISFAKGGYGTRKTISYSFVGGGSAYFGTTSIYQIPFFSIINLASDTSGTTVTITGSLIGSLPTGIRVIRLFGGTSSNVTYNPKDYLFTLSSASPGPATTFTYNISSSTFNFYGVNSGQTIYLVAYSESISSGSYLDIATGKTIYPNINTTPSNVITVVVP